MAYIDDIRELLYEVTENIETLVGERTGLNEKLAIELAKPTIPLNRNGEPCHICTELANGIKMDEHKQKHATCHGWFHCGHACCGACSHCGK